jgi:hypothetical protein
MHYIHPLDVYEIGSMPIIMKERAEGALHRSQDSEGAGELVQADGFVFEDGVEELAVAIEIDGDECEQGCGRPAEPDPCDGRMTEIRPGLLPPKTTVVHSA